MPKYPNITVKLVGTDSNAFSIIGNVKAGLKKGGVPSEEIDAFVTESMSGDYDNVIATAVRWVEVK